MSTEHWILAAIVVAGFGLNAWIAWQVHQAQVIDILQGRSIREVVDELHRMLLDRGGAR
jgi:hypothetical protein